MIRLLLFVLLLCTSNIVAFDPPSMGDPWYFQSDHNVTFWVPDKAQHYYGSYLLTGISSEILGDVIGSAVTFIAGFAWEVKDNNTPVGTPNGGIVGFSYKDLIADMLGIASWQINKHNTATKIYVDYDVSDEVISLHFTYSF